MIAKVGKLKWKEILNSDVHDATIDVAQIDARSGKRVVKVISQSKIRKFLNLSIWNEFLVAKACRNESNALKQKQLK